MGSATALNSLLLWPSVGHCPNPSVAWPILVAVPWRTADMQMRIRRAGKHHQGSGVAHDCRQTSGFRVERPEDHPVRANRDSRTRPVKRIGVAVLQSAIEHVD